MDELSFYVEPMKQADVATVATIERAIFTLPWSSGAFGYELRANPLSHYYVARTRMVKSRSPNGQETDPSIVGYGGFWMMMDEAHICTLGVHPDWRQRGVGELLLATMIEAADGLGAHVVTLEVRVSNQPAQNLYTKYGFTQVGVRKGYYSDNNEDAYIMTTEPINTPAYRSRLKRLRRMLRERLLQQQAEQE